MRLPRPSPVGVGAFVLFGAIIAILGQSMPDYRVDTGTTVGIYFIAILSLNLVLGYCGQISLGQGALMLVGAYATGILNHHGWTILETLPVAFLVSFAIGALLGLPALRLTGLYLGLVTFAFAVAMPFLPMKFTKFFIGGGNGFSFHVETSVWTYHVTWILAGLMFIGVWLLLSGRTGRAFRSIRDSEIAATSSGVNLPGYKVLAFAISGGIAGLAGSMFATVANSYVAPGSFAVLLSLTILIGAAVGGLGSLWGVLFGALFVGALPDISSSVPVIGNSHGLDVVYASIVILIMFVLPDGFAGLLRKVVLRATRAQRAQPPATPPPNASTPPASTAGVA